MIQAYLKELMENNSRVIIPDFGAFMIQSGADGKTITFNDFLKFNDGLLVNQIIKNEKITKNDATEKVKLFVKEIEQVFAQHKSYKIEGVGELKRDTHGNIVFSAEGFAPEAPADKADSKPEPKEEPVKPTDSKPIIELDSKEDATDKPADKPTDKPEGKPAEETKEEPASKPARPIPSKPKTPAPKPVPPSKPAAPKTPPPPPPVDKKEPKDTEVPAEPGKHMRKNDKRILLIFAAIIVLGGIGSFVVVKILANKVKKAAQEIVIPEPVIVPVDTTPEVDSTLMEEPKIVEEPAIDPNARKYYIVAGSFKVATNAANYNQKLINEGYPSEIVDRTNGFHTVTYKTFYSMEEALAEWRNMRSVNAETWILIR